MNPTQNSLTQIYRDTLGRDPDAGGMQYWSNQLSGGMSADEVRARIMDSQEYKTRATQPAQTTYSAPGVGSPISGADAQKSALGGAMNVVNQQAGQDISLPGYYGDKLQAPMPVNYAPYVQAAPMQRTQALNDGDYKSLETAMMAPVQQSWKDDQQGIKNMYSANGLYGSLGGGLMSGALTDMASKRDLASSNAVANRYAIQMKDLERMDQQNLNAWKADYANAGAQNAYNQQKSSWDYGQNEALRNFNNDKVTGQYNYGIDALNYRNGMMDSIYNKYAGLAGASNQAASIAAQRAASADANNANMWSGIGSGLGTFLGSGTGQSLLSPLWDDQGFELFSPSTWF